MSLAAELDRGEVREPVAERGFEAGYTGLGPGANPYRYWKQRDTWERHRIEGMAAYARYLDVMAAKKREAVA